MEIYKKLLKIQMELKAPKGQYNSFGKYKYRSCEDILEAIKPLCEKNGLVLLLSDTLENIGDRFYVKATAILHDTEKDETITNTAYAREELDKKGMDGSQITGTASSYARKYALNGMFCIDDTKDADTDEYKKQQEKSDKFVEPEATATEIVDDKPINSKFVKAMKDLIVSKQVSDFDVEIILKSFNYEKIEDIKVSDYMKIIEKIQNVK